MSVARFLCGTFTIGRIACRREGVFFPTENALSAGKGGWECAQRGRSMLSTIALFVTVRLLLRTCRGLPGPRWLRGPAVAHWSLADVLSLSCARLVADG